MAKGIAHLVGQITFLALAADCCFYVVMFIELLHTLVQVTGKQLCCFSNKRFFEQMIDSTNKVYYSCLCRTPSIITKSSDYFLQPLVGTVLN